MIQDRRATDPRVKLKLHPGHWQVRAGLILDCPPVLLSPFPLPGPAPTRSSLPGPLPRVCPLPASASPHTHPARPIGDTYSREPCLLILPSLEARALRSCPLGMIHYIQLQAFAPTAVALGLFPTEREGSPGAHVRDRRQRVRKFLLGRSKPVCLAPAVQSSGLPSLPLARLLFHQLPE